MNDLNNFEHLPTAVSETASTASSSWFIKLIDRTAPEGSKNRIRVMTLLNLANELASLLGFSATTSLITLSAGVVASQQALSGAGAVNLTTLITNVTSTGANALTLANGTSGQIKIIRMVVDGGDATLTPTTKTGFSTITFNDVGDTVVLQYVTTLGWMLISNIGQAGTGGATVA
jgi:hypothetical protein